MNDVDVLVIGAGISGLSTAWWLAQADLNVEVWEASARPGGKIQSHRGDGYLTEQAASMVMNFRPEVVELLREAELETAKVARSAEAEARRYLLHQGNLTTLPMRLGSMVSSPLWSMQAKLRMLLEPFIPANSKKEESVSQFVTRRLGREVLEKAMEPFIAGTLASDSSQASAAATLPRLTALERRYGSITAGIIINKLLRRRTAYVTETFSFRSGMSTLVDTLARTPGVHLASSYTVNELTPVKDGWRVTATTPSGQRTLQARQVVMATPAHAAARLLGRLDHELAKLLDGIRYAPLSVVHFGMDRNDIQHPLDGAGFLVPKHTQLPFNGNLWCSSLFPGRAPAGKVLLTSYVGGARMPQTMDWDDQRISDETLNALTPLLGIKGSPEMVHIDRHRQALPLYHGAYQARMVAISARLNGLPNLYLEANYRGGVSVRDRIARGQTVARQITAAHHQSTTGLMKTTTNVLAANG